MTSSSADLGAWVSGSGKLRRMTTVKIRLGQGMSSNLVEVDGIDLTAHVAALQVGRVAKEPLAHVTLHLNAAELELDAETEKVIAIQPATRPEDALQELLSGVDPGELEQEAMSRLGGLEGGPETPIQAILEVLRDWAKQA